MLGLYVHIPFCDKLCRYCDFAKVKSHVVDHEAYLTALAQEYALYMAEVEHPLVFDTVYFGGGTPSALAPSELTYLLQLFADVISQATEVTFEANPESLTAEKIAILRACGVNRVSLGVQTFDERRLRFLNRGHTNAQVKTVIEDLKVAGLTNINLDLMYALPGQSLDEVKDDVQTLLTLEPTHVSTYALIFEPHTPFYLQLQAKKLHEVDEDTQAAMYMALREAFTAAGYEQYEVSNWSLPGRWSKHNTKYWDLTEYIGLGLGAHGFYRGVRYANTRSIVNYIELLQEEGQKPIVTEQQQEKQSAMEEMMFLGLRLKEGVAKDAFSQRFGTTIEAVFADAIDKHVAAGHIIESPTHYKLAEEAIFISNDILSDFLLDDKGEK